MDRGREEGWGGVARGGVTDQGNIKGQTSADTQLSKPNQLHFIRDLRPITARSLEREKEKPSMPVGPLLLVFYRPVHRKADPSPGVPSLPGGLLRITGSLQ